ncbi:MAG: pilin [Patescibacteria group bacterium]|jgi:magnesium-transporting ATPase (P-type)
MKKILRKISILSFIPGFLPIMAKAQENTSQPSLLNTLKNVAEQGGYQTDEAIASTPIIVGTVINIFVGLLGIIFITLMVIAGYSWMTANGNEEKIKKAQGNIKSALIGLIIAVSAWTIWSFIFERLIMGQN